MAGVQNGKSEYIKLEQRLVLLAWLNELFGYENNRDPVSRRTRSSPSRT